MIDVRRLRVLRELADHGTVAAAAAALHLTPSAVSQQLAALTRETGVRLVEPDGRRVRLTDAAQVLLGHAHVVFAQLEQAEVEDRSSAGIVLATHEVAANAIAHADSAAEPVQVAARLVEGVVTVEVRDPRRRTAHAPGADELRLELIEELVSELPIETDSRGTTLQLLCRV